jgi:hypothetical protein
VVTRQHTLSAYRKVYLGEEAADAGNHARLVLDAQGLAEHGLQPKGQPHRVVAEQQVDDVLTNAKVGIESAVGTNGDLLIVELLQTSDVSPCAVRAR